MLNFEHTIMPCVLPCGEETSRWDLTMLKQAVLCDLWLSQILPYPQKTSLRNNSFHTGSYLYMQHNTCLPCQFSKSFKKSSSRKYFIYLCCFPNWVTQLCDLDRALVLHVQEENTHFLELLNQISPGMLLFHHLNTELQIKKQVCMIA